MANWVNTPNILWKIENFQSVIKKWSPKIKFMGLKFHMNFTQYIEASVAKVQLNFGCQNPSQAISPWQFKIEVCLSHNGGRYLLKSGTYILTQNEWCIWTDSVQNILKSNGQSTAVIFLIMITPMGNSETMFRTKESADDAKEMTLCAVSLRDDIGNLFNNAERSDFVVKCGNRSFFVHKAILSARSQYFAGMFRSDMKESNDKEGKIEKIDPDILELVLRYLYTGELPQLPMDSAQKVYAAADRLIVEPLKDKCLALFMDSVVAESEENFEKEASNEESVSNGQSETAEKEINVDKERQMLKDLFTSREWRLFSEEFPHKAHEMCKPYLLHGL